MANDQSPDEQPDPRDWHPLLRRHREQIGEDFVALPRAMLTQLIERYGEDRVAELMLDPAALKEAARQLEAELQAEQ